MNAGLLLFVGTIYFIVAVGYWAEGRQGLSLAFIAYAVANIGFALDTWR